MFTPTTSDTLLGDIMLVNQKHNIARLKRRLLVAFSIITTAVAWLSPVQVSAQAVSPVTKINEEAAGADITV